MKKGGAFDDRLGLLSVVAVGAMVAGLSWFKLSSIDTGFHVAYGREFLDTGHIVTLDPFLDPSIVKPFINGNWGTQVVMAVVERAGGATGLMVLRWTLIVIVFSCMAVIVRRGNMGWHWVAWAWLLAAMAAYERFALRPELFGCAVMMAMLVLLVRGPGRWRDIIALGVLQAAWTNLTYYFLVGVILTGSFLAGELLYALTARTGSENRTRRFIKARWLGAALLVQVAACTANPWHVRGAVHPIQTLRYLQEQRILSLEGDQTGGGTWAIIDEIRQPLRFLGPRPNYRTIDAYLVLLALAFAALMVLLLRRRWSEGLAIAVFLLMSLQMRRNIALFAFVATPLAVGGLAAMMPQSWARGRGFLWIRRGLILASMVGALGWTSSIISGRFYYVERRINREPGMGYSARTNLIDAAQWVSSQDAIQSKVFTDFSSSSNLLPRLDRRLKLLIDTNTFAFEEDWFKQIMEVSGGLRDHREFLSRVQVDTVLLRVHRESQELVRALMRDGEWALVYVDPHAVVFVRRTDATAALAASHRPRAEEIDVAAWVASADGPRYHRALSISTMGGVPYTLGWYEPAARLFDEAVRIAPDSAATWGFLALCHAKLASEARRAGDDDANRAHLRESVRSLEQVVFLEPDDAVAKENLDRGRQLLEAAR